MAAVLPEARAPLSLREERPQRWRDHGRLFDPAADGPAGFTHAAYPTPVDLGGGLARVFFTARDPDQRGCLFARDYRLGRDGFLAAGAPFGPLLGPGGRGEFDQSGVAPTSFVRRGGRILCYYLGWSRRRDTPFQNFIGLAVASGWDGPFRRVGRVPALDRSAVDPLTVGYPEVYRTDDGLWRMLYGSHHAWGAGPLEMLHPLHAAVSRRGARWRARRGVALDVAGAADPDEFALSRPTVLRCGDRWRMWHARRYAEYRLGCAVSDDGILWRRRDDLIGTPAEARPGFTERAVTYPCAFAIEGRVFLFYNGDGYGRTGFGATELIG